jgi:hypothetical protein
LASSLPAWAESEADPLSDRIQLGDSKFSLRIKTWLVTFDGSTSYVTDIGGDQLSLGSKLDLSEDFSAEVILGWQFRPKHRFELGYQHLNSKGRNSVREGVNIDGTVIPGIGRVLSDVEMHFVRFDWRRRLWRSKTDAIEVETIVGLLGFDIDSHYAAHAPGFGWYGRLPEWLGDLYHEWLGEILPDELEFLNVAPYYDDEFGVTAGLPVVGLNMLWRPTNKLGVGVLGQGMYLGDYGYVVDGRITLAYQFTDWFALGTGYRYWETEIEESDDEYNVVFEGIYAAADFRF